MENQSHMKACIIGLGETGESVALLLLQDPEIHTIHLLDPNPKTYGKFLDLSHAASQQNKSIELNQFKNSADCDVVFYCAGFRNTKNADRATKAKQNKELIQEIFQGIPIKEEALIICISNPVELMSEWIYQYLGEQVRVIGSGTELDTFRLRHIISTRLNIPVEEINVDVIGEHGTSMTPLYSSGKIQGRPISDYLNPNELNFITEELIHVASTIRRTQDATKFGVAQCAFNIWKSFHSESPKKHIISTLIPVELKEKLGIEKDIFVSIPAEINKNQIRIQSNLNLNKTELAQFRKAAKKIETIDISIK